uniref:Uncharacterized protein n=1 Tax=Arcella intermedia TaxID=1963864 RepID=A0A6B2LTA1_9EUKA
MAIISICTGPCQLAFQIAFVEGHECGPVDCVFALLCGICCAVKVRGDIREKYNIEGSLVGDVLSLWCCGACSLVQHVRQLQSKGVKPCGMFLE